MRRGHGDHGAVPDRVGRPRGRRKRSGAASMAIGIALLILGAGVMLYPALTDIEARGSASEALDEMRTETVGDSPAGTTSDGYRQKDGDPEYARLVDYNERVRSGTGDAINDPFAFPQDELDSFGLPDGILGSISVPALGIKVPLYLGATSENMVYGAGIVAGTSLPLGEGTSNTVIAAHRGGYYGMPMFRNIEDLEPGDQVVIETPWDKLVYRVSDFQIISPDDVDALRIEEGRDMVTLFTCHPYGHNYQRILVHCDRDATAEAEPDPDPVAGAIRSFVPTGRSTDSPLLNFENVLKLIGLLLLVGGGATLVARAARQMTRARARRRLGKGDGSADSPPDGSVGSRRQGSHFK